MHHYSWYSTWDIVYSTPNTLKTRVIKSMKTFIVRIRSHAPYTLLHFAYNRSLPYVFVKFTTVGFEKENDGAQSEVDQLFVDGAEGCYHYSWSIFCGIWGFDFDFLFSQLCDVTRTSCPSPKRLWFSNHNLVLVSKQSQPLLRGRDWKSQPLTHVMRGLPVVRKRFIASRLGRDRLASHPRRCAARVVIYRSRPRSRLWIFKSQPPRTT